MEFDTEDSTNALMITYNGIRYVFMRDDDEGTSEELLEIFKDMAQEEAVLN